MREVPLSDIPLLTTQEAATRREVNERTILRWVAGDVLPAVVVHLGERCVYLFRPRDVDDARPGRRGAPEGNQNAKKR